MSRDEPIDAVYTWVDGEDPVFQERVRHFVERYRECTDAHGTGPSRFHDNGEFRYSLRSLDLYAPWVRRVYVVTNGQVPKWLNRSNSRVSIVFHRDIFPDPEDLPTFNSRAIEVNLWRIPGLSRYFLHFNDDIFLGDHVSPGDFVTPAGGQRVYLENWDSPTDIHGGHVTDRACAHTQKLLDDKFGRTGRRSAIAHTPQLFDRVVMPEIEDLWGMELRQTSAHKFRHPTDVALRLLYVCYLLESPQHRHSHEISPCRSGSSMYCFSSLCADVGHMARQLSAIALQRPKFFCLNDDIVDHSAPEAVLARMKARAFLHWYYRQPSGFENPPMGIG